MKPVFRLFFSVVFLLFNMYSFGQGDEEILTYTITNTWIEGNSDSQTMIIQQSGQKAVAMFEGGDPKQVSDPDRGIKSARPDRNMPLLVDLMGAPASLKVGDTFSYVAESDARITALRYALEKGKDKQTLQGQKADHYILTVNMEWSYTSNGKESNGVSTGIAELWTAKKLPFSWLPYTVTDGYYQKAAIPLSYTHPEVAGFLLMHFEEDLNKRGLLLKARVESEQHVQSGGFEMNNRYVRELTVGNLETGPGSMPEVPDLPLVSEDQYKELLGWLLIAGDMCKEEQGKIASLAVETADQSPPLIQGRGLAEVTEHDEDNQTTWIVMGVLARDKSDEENGCLVIGTKPMNDLSSSFSLTSNALFADVDAGEKAAVAAYVGSREGNPELTILSDGQFEVREFDGSLRARLRGTGYTMRMSRTDAEIIEGVGGSFTFDLEPLAPEPPEVMVPAWVAISFNPESTNKVAEWEFDEGPAAHGTIDALGKLAAISFAKEPLARVIDLEKREAVTDIALPMSFGSRNMSLAMAPSGSRLAIGLTGGQLMIVNPRTGETLNEWRYPMSGNAFTEVKPLVFNEKRNLVIGASKGHTVAWDAANGNPVYEWEESASINDIDITPDGRYTLRSGRDGLRVFDLDDGSEVCTTASGTPALAVHPGGETVAVIDYDRKVSILKTTTCEEIKSWVLEEGWYPSIAWASDGQHILVEAYGSGKVSIFNSKSGEQVDVWDGGEQSRIFTGSHAPGILSVGPNTIFWK